MPGKEENPRESKLTEVSVFKKPGTSEFVVRPPFVQVSRRNPAFRVSNITDAPLEVLIPNPNEGFQISTVDGRCTRTIELENLDEKLAVFPFTIFCREGNTFAVGESNPVVVTQG